MWIVWLDIAFAMCYTEAKMGSELISTYSTTSRSNMVEAANLYFRGRNIKCFINYSLVLFERLQPKQG